MKKFLLGALVCAVFLPGAASAASGQLYLSPSDGVYELGKPFDVEVLANSDGVIVNAIEAELSYNPQDLRVESISTNGSILSQWATAPSYDGAAGIIGFSGWASGTYVGVKGKLVTVTFVPLRAMQSKVNFNSGTMLAADGQGSNIITSMRSGVFSVRPEQVAAVVPASSASTTTSTAPQETLPVTAQSAALPAAVQNSTSSQAAALLFAGADWVASFIPFFGLLALVAFGIAYFFHRKNIAF